ncbi:MAG: LysR substrate-binding domain-containing protein [Pseudorhodoplanes sp.]|nr:LysR substrate-binding domain-containing protein [Pseudorhodoplanes sp.]
MLREGRCDLLISPRPPSGTDIFQKLLFEDRYVCFYDPAVRTAPRIAKSYLAARHITVIYPDNERLEFDRRLAANDISRDISISVPNFYGIPAFLRGSDMLASMPSLLRRWLMKEFAMVPIPLKGEYPPSLTVLPMYMAWHQRFQGDPAHVWLRNLLETTVAQVVSRRPDAAEVQ